MRVFLLAAFLVGLAGSAGGSEYDFTILSKADSTQMFGMTEIQWVSNVKGIKQNQLGHFETTRTGEYTLYMRPDHNAGLLIVTPSYRETKKLRPWKLSVSIHMGLPRIRQIFVDMEASKVEAIILSAMRDMRPEYAVMGYLVRSLEKAPTLHFTIFESTSFQPISILNDQGIVCPTIGGKKQCVRDSMIGEN